MALRLQPVEQEAQPRAQSRESAPCARRNRRSAAGRARTRTTAVAAGALVAWSISCRRLRIVLRPFLLEIALAVPWTGTYHVIGDRLPFDCKRKIIKAIGDRVELLKDTVKLNGIDAAKGPVDASY